MRRRSPLVLLLVTLTAALAMSGCSGRAGQDRPERDATLLLDFQPNAVHAGIYLALVRGFDEAEGVRLRVREPSSSTDAVKLLTAGRVDFAILDIHDLALARERGSDLVGIAALVQRPLAAVLARPSVRRPRDLQGRSAGVTGLPSDDAVLDAIVRGDGGDPRRVRRITIGFQAVAALLAGRVDAATAFWNAEGVALRARRPATHIFRVDDYGAPAYPELVVCVRHETLTDARPTVAALARALRRGYDEALRDPASAVEALVERAKVDRGAATAELDAVGPALVDSASRFGTLDRSRLRAWALWEARVGITRRVPDVERAFAFGF